MGTLTCVLALHVSSSPCRPPSTPAGHQPSRGVHSSPWDMGRENKSQGCGEWSDGLISVAVPVLRRLDGDTREMNEKAPRLCKRHDRAKMFKCRIQEARNSEDITFFFLLAPRSSPVTHCQRSHLFPLLYVQIKSHDKIRLKIGYSEMPLIITFHLSNRSSEQAVHHTARRLIAPSFAAVQEKIIGMG